MLNMLGFLISVKFAIKKDVLLKLNFILSTNRSMFHGNAICRAFRRYPKTTITNFQAPSLNLKTMNTTMVYKPKPIIKKFNNLMYTCILQDSQQRRACNWFMYLKRKEMSAV